MIFTNLFIAHIEVTLKLLKEQKVNVNWAWMRKPAKRLLHAWVVLAQWYKLATPAMRKKNPDLQNLKPTQSIETINMEEAMELFKLPRNLGMFEGTDVLVNIGRFGPYASHDKKFYSLNKEMDPYSVLLEDIAPMIEEKRKAKDERTIKVFEKEKIQILKGPYGPYIKQGLRNYKLNKEQQEKAADLTIEEVKAIIEELKANPPKKVARRKKAK